MTYSFCNEHNASLELIILHGQGQTQDLTLLKQQKVANHGQIQNAQSQGQNKLNYYKPTHSILL